MGSLVSGGAAVVGGWLGTLNILDQTVGSGWIWVVPGLAVLRYVLGLGFQLRKIPLQLVLAGVSVWALPALQPYAPFLDFALNRNIGIVMIAVLLAETVLVLFSKWLAKLL